MRPAVSNALAAPSQSALGTPKLSTARPPTSAPSPIASCAIDTKSAAMLSSRSGAEVNRKVCMAIGSMPKPKPQVTTQATAASVLLPASNNPATDKAIRKAVPARADTKFRPAAQPPNRFPANPAAP
ncbi:hypothetical protein D3C86_1827590 [compost metagenome]